MGQHDYRSSNLLRLPLKPSTSRSEVVTKVDLICCGMGVDIDRKHSLAIAREIGGRLRSIIKEEPELSPALRLQLERLRKSEAATSEGVHS